MNPIREYDYLELLVKDDERMEILKQEGRDGWKFAHQDRTSPTCVRILLMKDITRT